LEPIRLGVNIDHVATLRQQRGTAYPDPVFAAYLAELAGAHQITVHLREDRRHIQDRDLSTLRATVQTRLNLEMAATPEMRDIALAVRPHMVTLVPEKRAERTTEGGLDLSAARQSIASTLEALANAGIPTSLFIDPTEDAIEASAALGAPIVELHTGDYCEATGANRDRELERVARAAKHGKTLGLVVAAGHGLDYANVEAIAALSEIEELNIGHSIVSRAVFVGFEAAVREMLVVMERARSRAAR
jgi:pyridoxine 5-phosphate synthase